MILMMRKKCDVRLGERQIKCPIQDIVKQKEKKGLKQEAVGTVSNIFILSAAFNVTVSLPSFNSFVLYFHDGLCQLGDEFNS